MAKLTNIHPGDVLLHEFLEPMAISQNRLARDMLQTSTSTSTLSEKDAEYSGT